MRKFYTVVVAMLFLLAGCATVTMSENNTTIVLAKKAYKGIGPSNPSDVFVFDDKVHAYVTFKWDDIEKAGGNQAIEFRWYNGDRLIAMRKAEFVFGKPPHSVFHSVTGVSLGAGKCRVEVYANDAFVASKSFRVMEK